MTLVVNELELNFACFSISVVYCRSVLNSGLFSSSIKVEVFPKLAFHALNRADILVLGSRSKSAVRSQRSLSITPIGDTLCDTFIDACCHKQHTRLESLRTFLVANNRLTEIPLLVPTSKSISSPKKKQRESRQRCSAVSYFSCIGTKLTTYFCWSERKEEMKMNSKFHPFSMFVG